MPGFFTGARDGAMMGQAIKQDYDVARNYATRVIDHYGPNKGIQQNDLPFANSLLEYLAKRRDESFIFSFNTEQVATRAQFIDKMLKALKDNDLKSQQTLLNSKEMLSFKGFFSSRLYDMLVERRGALKERITNQTVTAYLNKPSINKSSVGPNR